MFEKLMYKGMYAFLNNSNIIYNLQFGFWQEFSSSDALINITEKLMKFPMTDLSPICLIAIDMYP